MRPLLTALKILLHSIVERYYNDNNVPQHSLASPIYPTEQSSVEIALE